MTNFLVYFLSGKARDGESSISLIRLCILYLIINQYIIEVKRLFSEMILYMQKCNENIEQYQNY